MRINHLSLIITDDCNFKCAYCVQEKTPSYMPPLTVEKTLAFFYPFLSESPIISFYGGEPLLAFDVIRHTVSQFRETNRNRPENQPDRIPRFTLTTNGSLVNDSVLEFFHQHRFIIQLSFDGGAQDQSRKPGSLEFIRTLPERFKEYKNIRFSTLSVFSPRTAPIFYEAMQEVMASGSPDIDFTFSNSEPWSAEELAQLESGVARFTQMAAELYLQKGLHPVKGMQPSTRDTPPRPVIPDIPCCDGGRTRMAITPKEDVWGCFVFHSILRNNPACQDYKSYSFGKLDNFIKNHETIYPAVLESYQQLSQNNFFIVGNERRHCFLCDDLHDCFICPANASHSTGFIGELPQWACALSRIKARAKKAFKNRIQTEAVQKSSPSRLTARQPQP